jgi:hypothetical protein
MMMGSAEMLKPAKTKKCRVIMDKSDSSSDKEQDTYTCNILSGMSIDPPITSKKNNNIQSEESYEHTSTNDEISEPSSQKMKKTHKTAEIILWK